MESLNLRQEEAVTSSSPYICVLAGAGSGKTRVLTHRIVWLVRKRNISPYSILAITFTNKAAQEMRRRVEVMLGTSAVTTIWIGTFHNLAHRLLRTHWKEACVPKSFQILDSEDQCRLIRRIQKSLYLKEIQWSSKKIQWFINKRKEENQCNIQLNDSNDHFKNILSKVYKTYEEICCRSGLLDFPELLLRSLELLRNVSPIRRHYQKRFRYILVDEFQDTSTVQYAWLRTLMDNSTEMMIVGDDDQSIYSWRGATTENIQRFSQDFSDVQTVRLEQNYRSTQTILNAANAVIKNNANRFGKKLWTVSDIGERITVYAASNECEEAFYVISCIKSWIQREGRKYNDIAILYRSNIQSRSLENRLVDQKIPYRICSDLDFFERVEIKDTIAYLCLLDNRHSDTAFERVVNVPTRGVGNTALNALRSVAHNLGISLWGAAKYLIEKKSLNARTLSALQQFLNLIESLKAETRDFSLVEQIEKILNKSGLLAFYKKGVESLKELTNVVLQFSSSKTMKNEVVFSSPLSVFLAHIALRRDEEQVDPSSDCINLMTVHAAKGLEFPLVIINGLEENLFPHRISVDRKDKLEEERRLCYVGMTRAKEKLILTYAASRYMYGLEKFNQPSRFLDEIPLELINVTQSRTQYHISKSGFNNGRRIGRRNFCRDL
ncbi:DNA helicase II [Coxiella endosymbiont of Amblyomma sculptum]|uniref:UvrD-helicase domain-containing protein n=1 Tax=Coxiella endosymbiont of Amblyomma sculptum TaxID=2487929 RepID=UPI00132EB6F4|nr:UvrD-helicase domain-containing protein [Coxiella endosymbiont of Amblyomma sculptum]QHG92650.1 DNA helicase II [Coxiella endosymbiont of Amblyomma sculptum]